MAVLRVNADRDGTLRSADPTGPCWRKALHGLAARLDSRAPVVILIHGYRYCWQTPSKRRHANPQASLYRVGEATDDAAAWPAGLGFSADDPRDGLCIALGWQARHFGPGSFRTVHRGAGNAGRALVDLVDAIRGVLPVNPIHGFAHSLGARVLIQAVLHRPTLALSRAILMGGAENASNARAMLAAQDRAGATTEFYQIAARANDAFDGLYQVFGPRDVEPGDLPLGAHGLGMAHGRWLDLQLDHPQTRRWLEQNGFAPRIRRQRLSHSCFYLDGGAMAFYRSILREPRSGSICALRARAVPTGMEPRWSRLMPRLPDLRPGWGFGGPSTGPDGGALEI